MAVMIASTLTLGCIALWLWGRRYITARSVETQKAIALQQQFYAQMAEVVKARQLEQYILADALKREDRAKAAIKAVLLTCGATQEQIQEVLQVIEGKQEGDL